MGPKKATADKAKEKDQSDTEDIEPNRMERLEDELRELRDRLFDADRQITETRLQSLSETNRLTELLKGQEEINRQERENLTLTCEEKLKEMSRERDDAIHDMQERLVVYKQMHENLQKELTRKVNFREDDTVILSPSASMNFGSTYGDVGSFRQMRTDGLPSTSVPSNTDNCEPISTPKRACEPRTRRSTRFEDPWEGMTAAASMTRYDVPLPRQLVYDGKMSWDSFIKPFMSTASACRWNETDKHFRLISSLRGEAAEYVFNQLSPEITESFTGLQRALESRFREKRTSASYLNELESRKFSSKEKLLEYAADIKRLVHKGYPTADETTRDTINVRHFLRGLNDQTLAVAVGMKDPKTIDDAREMVETYNSLRDDVGRNQKVRSVSFRDNPNQKDPKSKWSMATDTKEKTCVTAKEVEQIIERKIMQGQKNRETFPEVKGQVQDVAYKKNNKFINKNHIECFKCHKFGHYANECQDYNKSPPLEKKGN